MTATGKSAYEKVRDAMASDSQQLTTEQLCHLLSLFEGCELDEAEHIVEAAIADELCARHPEADAAAETWSENPTPSESISAVIIRAALAAAS